MILHTALLHAPPTRMDQVIPHHGACGGSGSGSHEGSHGQALSNVQADAASADGWARQGGGSSSSAGAVAVAGEQALDAAAGPPTCAAFYSISQPHK